MEVEQNAPPRRAEPMPESTLKKAKIDGPLRIHHWLSQIDTLRTKFEESGPFRHVTLPNFLDDGWARKLLHEMLNNLQMTYKETDLFKFHQSKDISRETQLPMMEELKLHLFSPAFIRFLENTLGVAPGILRADHADMAAQCYSKGHHLICHDDVIGTRVVTFVLYLNSPDEAWTEDEGGAFELYESKDGRVMPEPTKKLLPLFNHATLFLVEPTKSYHAVEEIFGDRTRVSLQGWFHAKDITSTIRYEERHLCTVQELLKSPTCTALPQDLTLGDLDYLREWISAEYLELHGQEAVCAHFVEGSEVLLQDFFLQPKVAQVSDECAGFDLVGPPHIRKYLLRNIEVTEETKRLDELQQVLVSPAFARLVKLLTNLRVTGVRSAATRRFRRKHYSVATMGEITECKAELDVTWCQVTPSDVWETEEMGGFESYMEADTDDNIETQEIYRDNEQGPLINIIPRSNALSIVMRDRNTMKFVKYLSAAAPSSRTDIAVSFAIHDEDLPGSDTEDLPGSDVSESEVEHVSGSEI